MSSTKKAKVEEKACTLCRLVKPLAEFPKDPTHRDGVGTRCRRCRADATAKYRLAHSEQTKAACRTWRAANKERVAEMNRQYRAERPGDNYARVAEWRRANPELKRDQHHRRRAAKSHVGAESVSVGALFARDGGTCGICQKPVDRKAASIDHVIPLSKGGPHTYANTRLTHLACNVKRGNRWPAQILMIVDEVFQEGQSE